MQDPIFSESDLRSIARSIAQRDDEEYIREVFDRHYTQDLSSKDALILALQQVDAPVLLNDDWDAVLGLANTDTNGYVDFPE